MPDHAHDSSGSRDLRERAAADLLAGRTVSLSTGEMVDPQLRERLPDLLEELQRQHPESPPLRLHGYTVLGEIARGGMSTVYLAKHELLNRLVALKVVPSAFEGQERSRERTLREARAMAKVTHPNIVAVHEVVDTGETTALAMEWVDGLTFAQILKELPDKEAPGDLRRIAAVLGGDEVIDNERNSTATRWFVQQMRDIALAVQKVHDAGLLHLDIKPSNLLVRRDGTALLADFGVVREVDLLLTHTRSFAGTPIYAAPEQFKRRDAQLSAATDVYGLGITLYEMLARARPIHEGDLSRMLRDLETGRVPRLSSRCHVPADLENLVHKAIDPDPRRRYATAAALAADLTAFLEHRQVTARPWTRMERLRRWARAEPWKAIAAASIALLAPIVAGLSIKLILDLPHLRAVDEATRRKQNMSLAHSMLRGMVISHVLPAAGSWRTQRNAALAADDPLVLACHIISRGGHDFAADARLLEDFPQTHTHLGLTLLAARLAARRVAFSTEEWDQLMASRVPLDQTIAVLDRLMWMGMMPRNEVARDLVKAIDLARLTSAQADPLLLGARVHLASTLQDTELFDQTSHAIETLWPDDPDTLSWISTSLIRIDANRAEAYHRGLAAKFPDHLPTQSMRVVFRMLHDETPHLENVEMTGLEGRRFEASLCMSKNDRQGLLAVCNEIVADPDESAIYKAVILMSLDPARAVPFVREELARDAPLARSLKLISERAKDTENRALVEDGLRRLAAAQPPSWAALSLVRLQYGTEQDMPRAASTLALLQEIDGLPTDMAWYGCIALSRARDWQQLHRYATAMLKASAKDSQRHIATFYLAMAKIRLGDDTEGMRLMKEYLAGAGNSAYPEAHQEHARYLASPDTPATERDPERALALCDMVDRRRRSRNLQPSPWHNAVRAEAEFANGNVETAVKLATEALTKYRDSNRTPQVTALNTWPTPHDFEERLQAALERYGAAAPAAEGK